MSIDQYNNNLNRYYNYAANNMYTLEVEKLCKYNEFVMVHKNSSIIDVCNAIFRHFECENNEKKRLFVKNANGDICDIVTCSSTDLFRVFIKNNKDYFTPIYPIPCNVTYKIYIEDGHIHS